MAMKTNELIQAMKGMTTEQRMDFLRTNRPAAFEVKAPVLSFGKAPKDGWTEADRIAK